MTARKRTLSRPVKFEGRGLHSGIPVLMTVHPSNQGIAFRLGRDRVVASPINVTGTSRCTNLGPIGTVEHLMSALGGLEITDAEVELTAPEVPGMDGSCAMFVEGFVSAGFQDGEPYEAQSLFRRLFLHEPGFKIAIAKGNGHWRYTYETGNRWPGTQTFEADLSPDYYEKEIAPARTFALEEELPMVRQAGLGQGLDEDSALLLGQAGYLNPFRFPDEPARHKLLDLIGDLYLAGVPIRSLSVAAERSGHTANVRAALQIKGALES